MAAIKDDRTSDIEKYAKEWAKKNNINENKYEISFKQVKTSFDLSLDANYNLRDINTKEKKVVLVSKRFYNNSDLVQENTFAYSEGYSFSTRCTVKKGIKLGALAEVKIGFPAALASRFQIKGELNLSKADEQSHESKRDWTDSFLVKVPPRSTVVAKVLIIVKNDISELTAEVKLTGLVRFVPKNKLFKMLPGKKVVSVQELLSNKDGFEELKDESGDSVIGVKYKATVTLEGSIEVCIDNHVDTITEKGIKAVDRHVYILFI